LFNKIIFNLERMICMVFNCDPRLVVTIFGRALLDDYLCWLLWTNSKFTRI